MIDLNNVAPFFRQVLPGLRFYLAMHHRALHTALVAVLDVQTQSWKTASNKAGLINKTVSRTKMSTLVEQWESMVSLVIRYS